MNKKKYSLWKIEHESVYSVMAYKVRDTDSWKEVDKWIDSGCYNAASFYRIESELKADYLQTFE